MIIPLKSARRMTNCFWLVCGIHVRYLEGKLMCSELIVNFSHFFVESLCTKETKVERELCKHCNYQ